MNWRFFLKHRIFEIVEAEADPLPAGAEASGAISVRLRPRYRALPAGHSIVPE